jgi:manganese-dependent ADP-ribose/CDP-alcohol diphosphatase
MINRRQFAAAVAAFGFPFVSRGATKPLLNFGLVADPQYADAEPWATRFYRQSIGKLGAAVDHFNGQELDFSVNCGDCIDHDWASFDPIMKVFGKSKVKFYHVLGNHDFELTDDKKAAVAARVGMEKKYYSFVKGGFCFVFLDTNDVSVYANALKAPETAAAVLEYNRRAATGAVEAQTWNGAIGTGQLKWLNDVCAKANEDGQKVLLIGHHPVWPAGNSHNLWNPEDVFAVTKRHRNVVAWINGHNHAGDFGTRDGVPFLTVHGMVETKDTNAYATVQLHADRMVISGHGREPSREVLFRG